jgi:DnaK suppressor protein
MSDRERQIMTPALSPGQRALLQQLLQMRLHELDRRVASRQGGASRSEHARELMQQDHDDAPQRDTEREVDLARADRDIEELGTVSDALARVHDAGFGLCVDCDRAIAFDRLKLEPWALRCVVCQAARERASASATPRARI